MLSPMLSRGSTFNPGITSAFSPVMLGQPANTALFPTSTGALGGSLALSQQADASPINNLSALAGNMEATGSMFLQCAALIRMLLQMLSALQTLSPTSGHQAPAYQGGNNGQYWGDPHLVGFDGEKYDVMGQPGKTYNMLSDQTVQYNTTFEQWGNNGATVIGKSAIQVGANKVYFDRSGKPPAVDGQEMKAGDTVKLDNGGFAQWDGKRLTVNTGEYTISLEVKEPNHPNGAYLDSHVTLNEGGPFSDFVAPHGLLGQTADGIKGLKNSGKDQGKQGGTVIDGTVTDYEVSDLWKHDDKFNRFGVQIGQVISNPADGTVHAVLDTQGHVLFKTAAGQLTVAA